MNKFDRVNILTLSIIGLLSLAISGITTTVKAQQESKCFMVDSSGKVRDLSHLCEYSRTQESQPLDPPAVSEELTNTEGRSDTATPYIPYSEDGFIYLEATPKSSHNKSQTRQLNNSQTQAGESISEDQHYYEYMRYLRYYLENQNNLDRQ